MKLLQVVQPEEEVVQAEEEGMFVDRGSANPSPSWGWEYYEKKYGKPDESNVEGYWIDDEIEVELEKPTGKERQQQQELERERDYSDPDYTQEEEQQRDEEYLNNKLDILYSAGFGR